jgi:hypothetical protein
VPVSRRQVDKMLREIAGGAPVEVSLATTTKRLSRLAFIAEQFGYEYADIWQTGGQQNRFVLLIVPDPSPQARTRAARNWTRYPDAANGGELPPLIPEAIKLLRARMRFDLTAQRTSKVLTVFAVSSITSLAVGTVALSTEFGADPTTAMVIAGITWISLMPLVPLVLLLNRRSKEKHAARLEAAGFTPETDHSGRLRYVPPGGRTPPVERA